MKHAAGWSGGNDMRTEHRRLFLFFAAALVLVSVRGSAAAADAPDERTDPLCCLREYKGPWGSIEAGFVPEKTDIVTGEPLFITFQVRNTGRQALAFEMGGDYRGTVRHNDFMIVGRVVNAGGAKEPLSDPYNYNHGGGPVERVVLAPEQTYRQALLLQNWVSLAHDGGSPWSVSIGAFYTIRLTVDVVNEDRDAPVTLVPVASSFLLSVDKGDEKSLGAVVERLAKQCTSIDPAERKKAWWALSYVNHKNAAAVLIDHLTSAGPGGTDAEDILKALSRLLQDERVPPAIAAFAVDPKHLDKPTYGHAEACRLLSKCEHKKAKEALFFLAQHGTSSIQHDAIRYLARYPKEEVLPVVRRLINESKPTDWLRSAAVYTLCELGEPFDRELVLPLIRAWPGPCDGSSRVYGAVSLFRYGNLTDARALAACLRKDESTDVSSFNQEIIRMIRELGGPKHPYTWLEPRYMGDKEKLEQNRKTLDLYRAWAQNK